MKAQLTFEYDPEDPNEVREILLIQQAKDWKGIVWDLDQWLREEIKYRSASEEVEKVRTKLHELLNEGNLDINE